MFFVCALFLTSTINAFELREKIIPVKISNRSCAYALEKTNLAVDNGVISLIQGAIFLDYSKQLVETGDATYILALDNARLSYCTEANPCFDLILDTALTECWKKVGDTAYESLYTNIIYTYDFETGRIE